MVKIDLHRIKRRLDAIHCQKCGKAPVISIIGNDLDINCCLCEWFKDVLIGIAEDEVSEQAVSDIKNEINHMFQKF